jgi:hypothetical protein
MTRKDYVALAHAIKISQYGFGDRDPMEQHAAQEMRARVAKNVADALAADNGRFDRERFLTACEVA